MVVSRKNKNRYKGIQVVKENGDMKYLVDDLVEHKNSTERVFQLMGKKAPWESQAEAKVG